MYYFLRFPDILWIKNCKLKNGSIHDKNESTITKKYHILFKP